ncbi:MAG: acyltransferase [Methylococcaceae bacterium]|nr:acyltransferase [Methylococcaceae bacterium]
MGLPAKIQNIQALRGLAALLVLATHVMTIERKYSHSGRLLPDWLEFGTSGVDLFFVISGFIMVHITRGWFQQPYAPLRFLSNRVTRIYPLYWCYSLLVLAVYLWRPQWVNASQGSEVDLVASFLLLPQEKLPLLAVGWSLVYEMYFYLVFAGLLLLKERWLPLALLAWIGAVTAAHFAAGSGQTPAPALVTSPYCLEFGLGCLVALRIGHGAALPGRLLLPAALLVPLGWYAAVHWFHAAPLPYWRVAIYGLPYAFLTYALVSRELASSWTCPNWLVETGDASYSIYLSHSLLISAIGRLWSAFDSDGLLDNGAMIAFMFTAAWLWGRISFGLLERPLLQSWRTVRGKLIAAFAT